MQVADDLFFCWSFMCWEVAKNRYTYGILAIIYRYTTYLVPGGFGSWIIFLALTCCPCCVLVMIFTCHIHRRISYPLTHHTRFLPWRPSLNNEMLLVGGVVVLRPSSSRTNRNPLTHQPTPTYLWPPSHRARFLRWRASLNNDMLVVTSCPFRPPAFNKKCSEETVRGRARAQSILVY